MIRRLFPFRLLLTTLLAMLLAAPVPAAAPVAVPNWLAGSLCLADHAPDDRQTPASSAHIHCTLCLAGVVLFTPPLPQQLTRPAATGITHTTSLPAEWSGPATGRPYASRAPPIA